MPETDETGAPERLMVAEVGDIGGEPGVLLRGSREAVKAAAAMFGEEVELITRAHAEEMVRAALEDAAAFVDRRETTLPVDDPARRHHDKIAAAIRARAAIPRRARATLQEEPTDEC
jgi:KaiC/GvpD/RAD55 family RecA-like ATPase